MSQVSEERAHGGRLRIPRSRGAASGFLIVVLGLWGALVPFVGPAFDFAYDPDQGSAWSAARGWMEVLPGVVAGAWFVVGRVAATTLTIGEIGAPVAETETKAAWLELTYFYGLGALIVFLGATALGRLSVRSGRDITHAQRARAEAHDDSMNPAPPVDPPVVATADPPRRRSWRNPLGRRRDNPTPAAR